MPLKILKAVIYVHKKYYQGYIWDSRLCDVKYSHRHTPPPLIPPQISSIISIFLNQFNLLNKK